MRGRQISDRIVVRGQVRYSGGVPHIAVCRAFDLQCPRYEVSCHLPALRRGFDPTRDLRCIMLRDFCNERSYI